MMIQLNNNPYECSDEITVKEFLDRLIEDPQFQYIGHTKVRVILNRNMVSPDDFESQVIRDGDSVSLLPVVQGG